MFKPVGSLFKNTQISSRSSGAIMAMRVRQVAKDIIDSEMAGFGEEILKSIKVATLRGGVLTITAPPIVLGELHMRSGGLIREANKALGAVVIKSLRLRGK